MGYRPHAADQGNRMSIILPATAPEAGTPSSSGTQASYAVLFAQQRRINLPHYAHSFGAFVQVDETPNGPANEQVVVISWLPRSLKIGFFRAAEPGHNLLLPATFDYAQTLGTFVSAWGPFRIRNMLFEKARDRYLQLESGATKYVVLDNGTRPLQATNCIHALSDLGLTDKLLSTGTAYGMRASRKIVRYLQPWIMDSFRTHPWVADLLCLNRYAIEYQEELKEESFVQSILQPVGRVFAWFKPRVRYS
jgi:hypothetical protein